MKTAIIVILTAFLMSPIFSSAQTFDKYADMDHVSSMLVTSEMFKLLAEIDYDSSDPEMQKYIKLIENLDNIQVFTTNNAQVRSEMVADVQAYLNRSSMKKLMSFNESGQSVEFYSKPGKTDSQVSELLMFMKGKENGEVEAVIMRITGNVDLKQISKLAKDLEVPGATELKKIDEKQ